MSLFSDYINEIDCGRRIIELPDVAFATFYIHQDLKECYIEDLFISKEYRSKGILSALIKQITDLAKEHGCDKLTHGIVNKNKNKNKVEEISRKLFGFKPYSETENEKNFIKELDNG